MRNFRDLLFISLATKIIINIFNFQNKMIHMHILHLVLAGLLTFSSPSDEWIRDQRSGSPLVSISQSCPTFKKRDRRCSIMDFPNQKSNLCIRRRMYEIEYGKRDIQRPYRSAIVPTNEKRDPDSGIGRPQRRKKHPA